MARFAEREQTWNSWEKYNLGNVYNRHSMMGMNLDSNGDLQIVRIVGQNDKGLVINQKDTTNNPIGLEVINAGTGNGVFVDQDGNGIALNIDSEATTADVLNIAPTVLTTGIALDIADADALTTGKIARFASDSADTSVRNLVEIINDNTAATSATGLLVQQDSTVSGVFVDQNGNGIALNIDSEATTADVVSIAPTVLTAGIALDIADADALTGGKIARFASDSADTSARNLVEITNDNTAATGAIPLRLQQDSTAEAMKLEKGTTDGGFLNFSAAADGDVTSAISTLTTSAGTTHHVQIEINGAKAWVAASTTNPS